METALPGSIMPWLLGGLLLLEVAVLAVAIKSWREAKRSPYFFLRQQAAKKMRSYMGAGFALFLVTAGASTLALRSNERSTPLFAPLSHAKPLPQSAPDQETALAVEAASPESVEINFTPDGTAVALADLTDPLLRPAGPEPGTAIEEGVSPAEKGAPPVIAGDKPIGRIAFSTDISDNFQAIEPGQRFIEGYFTLYATFAYQGMVDGVDWGWTWKRNGQVLEGEQQVWSYGQDGPGYIYFTPESGFQQGQYSLEVWVDDQLMSQASFMVTDGIAASN